jgi:Ca-activated chloride channel family protein
MNNEHRVAGRTRRFPRYGFIAGPVMWPVITVAFLLLGAQSLEANGVQEAMGSGGERSSIERGNQAYRQEAYAQAAEAYEAARSGSHSSIALFNLGTSLYKQQQYQAALQAFRSVNAKEPGLAKRTHYNQGNTLAKLGKQTERVDPEQAVEFYRKSVDAYKRTLAFDNAYRDAARNIEVVRHWIDQLQGQGQGGGNQQQQGSQSGSQGQQQQQQGQDSQSGNQNQQNQQNQDGQGQSGESENSPQQNQQDQQSESPARPPQAQDPSGERAPRSADAILRAEQRRREQMERNRQRGGSDGTPTW